MQNLRQTVPVSTTKPVESIHLLWTHTTNQPTHTYLPLAAMVHMGTNKSNKRIILPRHSSTRSLFPCLTSNLPPAAGPFSSDRLFPLHTPGIRKTGQKRAGNTCVRQQMASHPTPLSDRFRATHPPDISEQGDISHTRWFHLKRLRKLVMIVCLS